VEALQSPDPLQAFTIDTFSPVMKVPDDDTKLVESEAEARRRWPEFEQAMKEKLGQDFVVKAPVTVGDNTEFIWINVEGLAGDEIHGTLENEPMNLEGLRHGSKVIVGRDVVSDWAFSREGEVQGFFSKEVFFKN
jgi:uncharacterized protein YegJ (DUF2314 family)